MKYALYFERFLNPERVSLPDNDIDFCYPPRPSRLLAVSMICLAVLSLS